MNSLKWNSELECEVRVFLAFTFIRKSEQAPALDTLSLGGLYLKRNIELHSTEKLNLSGVARLIASKIKHRVRRRIQRTQEKVRRALGMSR